MVMFVLHSEFLACLHVQILRVIYNMNDKEASKHRRILPHNGIVLQVLPLAECRILVKSPAEEARATWLQQCWMVSRCQVVKDHALVDGNTGVAGRE